MDDFFKKKLFEYGFFLGVTVVLSLVLVPALYFSQSTKNRIFAETIQSILDETSPSTNQRIKVVRPLKEKSPFAATSTVFELSESGLYAVILRVETFYGPKPAVFLCGKTKAEFLGWALPQGKAASSLSNTDTDINILYWENKIPSILQNTGCF